MAHAFKPIPAKPTFGTLTQVVYQGDYITNKKAKLAFCKGNKKLSCNKNNKVSSYDQSNLFNKAFFLLTAISVVIGCGFRLIVSIYVFKSSISLFKFDTISIYCNN